MCIFIYIYLYTCSYIYICSWVYVCIHTQEFSIAPLYWNGMTRREIMDLSLNGYYRRNAQPLLRPWRCWNCSRFCYAGSVINSNGTAAKKLREEWDWEGQQWRLKKDHQEQLCVIRYQEQLCVTRYQEQLCVIRYILCIYAKVGQWRKLIGKQLTHLKHGIGEL